MRRALRFFLPRASSLPPAASPVPEPAPDRVPRERDLILYSRVGPETTVAEYRYGRPGSATDICDYRGDGCYRGCREWCRTVGGTSTTGWNWEGAIDTAATCSCSGTGCATAPITPAPATPAPTSAPAVNFRENDDTGLGCELPGWSPIATWQACRQLANANLPQFAGGFWGGETANDLIPG